MAFKKRSYSLHPDRQVVGIIVKLRVRVRIKVKSQKSKLDPEVGVVMGWPTHHHPPPLNFF